MKKETIITAIIFFAVGFLAGYITDAQLNWSAQKRAASAPHVHAEDEGGTPASGGTGGGLGQGLPEGHPPIDNTALVKTLEEQANQNPRDPEPRLQLANHLYDQHQWQKAIEWYRKALELDPKNVNARTDMGTAYFYLGRPQEALEEYRKSLAVEPTHQPTLFNSIVVNLEGTRDFAAAQQAWEKLHKLNSGYPGLARLKERLDAARSPASTAPVGR